MHYPTASLLRRAAPAAAAALIVLVAGCGLFGESPEQIHARADKAARQAVQATSEDFVAAAEHYARALHELDRLLAEHPESEIAQRLESGEAEIDGRTLAELRAEARRIRRLAQMQAKEDLFTLVERLMESTARADHRARLRSRLVDDLVVAEQYERAARLSEGLEAPQQGAGSVAKILALASAGRTEEARALAEDMSEGLNRAIGRFNLVEGMTRAGNKEAAGEELDKLVEFVDTVQAGPQGLMLVMLGKNLARMGYTEDALTVAESISERQPHFKSHVHVMVAEAFMDRGETERAREAIEKAYRYAQRAKPDSAKLQYTVDAAVAMAQLGEDERASDIFDHATRRLDDIAGDQTHLSARATIAQHKAEAGRSEEAHRLMDGVLETAAESDFLRVGAKDGVPSVLIYGLIGRVDRAVGELVKHDKRREFIEALSSLAVVMYQRDLSLTRQQKHRIVAHIGETFDLDRNKGVQQDQRRGL